MDHQEQFHCLIAQLLRHMHIDLPPEKRDRVYSLKVDDKTDIHLLSPQPGKLDVLAEAGTLTNKRASDILLALLALNRFHESGLPLSVSVAPASGMVSLWSRRNLSEVDLPEIVALIEKLLAGVAAIQKILASGPITKFPRPHLTTANFLRTVIR